LVARLKEAGTMSFRTAILFALFHLIAAACSSGLLEADGDAGGDFGIIDVVTELVPSETVTVPDLTPGDLVDEVFLDVDVDIAPDIPILACQPGEGCFLDNCSENSDCQSSWCVEHLGEGVCTETCQEECPPGWKCKQVGGTDPDVIFICVSEHANLCKPCQDSGDCNSTGGAEDVCVSYGDEGNFCGGKCLDSQDCPWGFSCAETETSDGILTSQCVADAGVCPCTGKSIELALWTNCVVNSEWGQCAGKRACLEEGLTDCDALTPMAETCNGLDDNCDGDIDEPVLLEGKLTELCNDDNGCTEDLCKGESGCAYTNLSEGECMDGDPCTVGDHCEAGACIGLPVVCDDANPCTDDICDGAGGCTAEFNQDDCDDGDPCTVNDICKQGDCNGFKIDCQCLADSDCAQLEDGDLCNGTLYCETDKLPHQCAVDAETVVVCPVNQDADSICTKTLCNPGTAECEVVSDHQGFACDDQDACTAGDKCDDGICLPGVAIVCNDGNVCTDDTCLPETGCQFTNITGPCNDGDACTLDESCQDGLCGGGVAKVCDDGNDCTSDQCDPQEGCVFTAVEGQCDDDNMCTVLDLCIDGKCVGSGTPVCEDQNSCTSDFCLPATGCEHMDVDGACTDGNACTLNDYCSQGMCVSGPLVECNDNNPCTSDSCGNLGICEYESVNGDCDDGNMCTQGDKCLDGVCTFVNLVKCDDDNPCTDDSCDPAIGCVYALNAASCDDGDLCTTGDKCQLGACVSSGTLTCSDGNDCTTDSCNPKAGCEFVPNSDDCNDGNECSVGDHCSAGWCVPDTYLTCNDDNPCTNDVCDGESGCVYSNNAKPCTDGNMCTDGDTCTGGQCIPGPAPVCNDDNVCTKDSCDPFTGCVYTGIEGSCNDDDMCTKGDYCSEGVCQSGDSVVCDDGNECTDDGCNPATGCTFLAIAGECDDSDECTSNDMCIDGKCTGGPGPDCNDNNECTDDSCDSGLGCQNTEVQNGTECTQNGGHVCQNGACVQYQPGSISFTYTGSTVNWTVPPGVGTVKVCVVGGGGGGAGSHNGGGGSGWVVTGSHQVSGTIQVTVGGGGNGGISGDNQAPGSKGGTTSFGNYVSATGGDGGHPTTPSGKGGDGGSGGGGAGNAGCAGKGGSAGSDGVNGCTYPGGNGGHFGDLSIFTLENLTAGAGGAAGQSSHSGGGGAGGVLIDGAGPTAANGGQSWSGKGGQGYGSGGGAGGYNNSRPPGGKGADGVIYVEW
jgi:hypothetical protein